MLTKQQIRRICLNNDFNYRITKRPTRLCGVDVRIARDPRYSKGNLIEVCSGSAWHTLGYLWDIEGYTVFQIAGILNKIAQGKGH
jgi:hypothetical protein